MEIRWQEDLTRETVAAAYKELRKQIRRSADEVVLLALAPTVRLDSSGAGLLEELRTELATQNRRLHVSGGDAARSVLAIYGASPPAPLKPPRPAGLVERTGESAFNAVEELYSFLILTSDTLALSARALVKRSVPARDFIAQAVRMGSQSLPIIALISFLVGLTTALQAAYQLRQFGANIYIANLVGVAMLAEMGPLMTAILMAGRCGSSIAAEISTMVIAEEIDALKTMGVEPLRYVLLPRLFALVFTQPLLTVMSICIGILGGMLVGVTYLDLSIPAFWNQLVDGVVLKDFIQAMLKSLVFALIIGLTAAHVGFRARGGATGVGRSTTAAVVASIFLVIVADAIFSLIFYFGA